MNRFNEAHNKLWWVHVIKYTFKTGIEITDQSNVKLSNRRSNLPRRSNKYIDWVLEKVK